MVPIQAQAILEDIPHAERRQRFYRPELDTLRFFAAFGVVVFHSFPKDPSFWKSRGLSLVAAHLLSSVIGAGGFGVDLFFALSAFLITELLLREREHRGFVDVKAFYVRRILRIWPLYFFFIALAWVISRIDLAQEIGWNYILAFLLLSGNWIVSFSGAPSSVIVPLWSVSVEEQFYLVWPVAIRKLNTRGIMAVSAAMLLVGNSARFALAYNGYGANAIWCNTFARLDPIALGIVLALVARHFPFNFGLARRCGLFLLGATLWTLTANFGGLHDLPTRLNGIMLGYPAAAIGSICFLTCAYRGPECGVSFLNNPMLVYLGRISYGIYVFHELGLLISHYVLGAYTKRAAGYMAYCLLAWVCTIGMAALSYRWIERPFLKLKERFTFVKSRPAE